MNDLIFGLGVGLIILVAVCVAAVVITWIVRTVWKATGREDGAMNRQMTGATSPEALQVQPPAVRSQAVRGNEPDTQLAAVIAAALMMCQETGKKMTIKSIRRVGSSSAWAQAGRREQLQ